MGFTTKDDKIDNINIELEKFKLILEDINLNGNFENNIQNLHDVYGKIDMYNNMKTGYFK